MSRRSSRITRSTRKRPREIEEEYSRCVSEVTGQEDNSEEIIQEQKKLRKR